MLQQMAAEESVEEVWTEFKEGTLSTAAEVCGVRHNKGQRKRTRWWNWEVKEAVKKKVIAIYNSVGDHCYKQ